MKTTLKDVWDKIRVGDRIIGIQCEITQWKDFAPNIITGKEIGKFELNNHCWRDLSKFEDCVIDYFPQVKTLDNLEVGDMVKTTTGPRKVLAFVGEMVALSCNPIMSDFNFWTAVGTLKKEGATIITPDPVEVVEEMTVSEICKALGKTVKIKKESYE